MPFIARAAILLNNDYWDCEKDKWFIIKTDTVEYRWKLRNDLTIEIICGLFLNRSKALVCAKKLYVFLLYKVLESPASIERSGCEFYQPRFFMAQFDGDEAEFYKNEEYFFWSMKNRGGHYGPGVFEVQNTLEEIDDYSWFDSTFSVAFQNYSPDFKDIEKAYFTYSRESQELLNAVVYADRMLDSGMRMVSYCSILEHLSEEQYKDPDTIAVLDDIIQYVNNTTLGKDKKTVLTQFINSGRRLSARQRCIQLCERYAQQSYVGIPCKKIFDEAYSIRSTYAHGGNPNIKKDSNAFLIKYVVLDVIKNIMREKEGIIEIGIDRSQ